jgi:thiol-disulfide isomerase/thioredoxin
MIKGNRVVFGLILFIAFMAAAYFSYTALAKNYKPNQDSDPQVLQRPSASLPNPSSDQKEKTAAPDFTVYDADGNTVKLSDLKGKPVVVNFWASWCPPCKRELPDFDEVYLDYKDDVVFMMVDLVDGQRETQETGQTHVDGNGYIFPVYFDTKQDAAYTYQLSAIPDTLFIDSEGNISNAYKGAIDKETLEKEISLIMK